MVGVAGRSKGCNTCRRRKKGCDLQRPECRRCLKGGFICTGYKRERVFIRCSPPKSDTEQQTTQATPALMPPFEDVTLHPALARSAQEAKYMGMFWELYTPDRKPFLQTLANYSYANCWVPSMRRLQQNDSALHKIMTALCVETLGRWHREEWMRQASSRAYLGALQDMNTALRTPSRRNSDALLLASKMFGLYDELICDSNDEEWANISSGTSWLDHGLGQLGLILQRPPAQYVEGVAHSLFVEGRMATSMMSIVHRKRTALSTGEWTTVPWKKVQKTSRDMVFDIMSDISGILEDFDRVRALENPVQREEQYLLVVEECWRTDHKLTWWLDNISPSKDIGDLIRRNFVDPTGEDVAVAYIMSHYWAACVPLYSTLRLALAAYSADEVLCLPERADPRTYCKNIIDATEVLHHPVAGAFGTHAQLFPLSMAAAYLLAMESSADGGGNRSPLTTKLLSFFYTGESGARLKKLLYSMFKSTMIPQATEGAGHCRVEQMAASARAWFGMEREESLEAVVRSFCILPDEWNCV